MNDTRIGKKDKKQYIQVFVRVRPINNAEKTRKSVIVVDTPSNKEVVVRERLHDKFTKKFTFDKVFGSQSKQIEVYNAVVSPMVQEVLAGYNCTVFAYGQTGTGKTFTMEGTENDELFHWQTDTNAGVIPRALSHLFDELSSSGVQEYSVRVSFIEIYNEEIYDLLSPNDDAAKIRIYEDPTKKGAVIIHGTEEVSISNKKEVFKILKKGSEKRQTAATLMNARSSRSHTILSITVHIKENSINGEELLKTGKLNLVDLAGSENIGRSGAVDRRAREAGSINQSLLTLGRVITALVENTPHIPYRESKLTRLLQESLGGRTRTSIIATISPASINVEETLSTLDYSYRAKNITNRPEINQKFSKKALLREYTEEIERLKKDLIANRERNGIYLTPESYNQMQSLIEFQTNDIKEKLNYITALEESMNSKQQIFTELKSRNSEQAHELITVKGRLETTVDALMFTSSRLVVSEQEKEEQKHLVEKYQQTENILLPQVQTVLDVADTATTDVHKLHEKIYRKIQIGQRNNRLGQQFKDNMKERIRDIATNVSTQTENLMQFWTSVKNRIDGQSVSFAKDIDKSNQVLLQELINSYQSIKHDLTKTINDSYFRYQQWLESENKNVTNMTSKTCNMLNNISIRITQKFHQLIKDKILEDLRVLNSEFSEEVDNLVVFMKETGISASKRSAEEQSRSVILEITELVKDIGRYKDNAKEKRTNFVEMMEDLQRCFNEVQKEEEENYISECNMLSCIDETSNIINNQASDSYKMRIEKQNVMEEKMQNDLQTGKQVVLEGTDKSRLLVENIIARSKMLISEFQANLDTNCATLTSYKNYAERNSREMQEKMEEDKNLILSAINDTYEKMCNATNEHVISLSDCKMAFTSVLTEMSEKLESENTNAANTNSTITAIVQEMLNQTDKFFTDDLYRDVPTGLTPAKKNFQYSKKLIKTSPHERLLKRYRQTLEDIEHIESEPIILPLNDSTPTEEAVSES